MAVIAGVDVGNATTEIVLVSGGVILGAGRVPTRGRKGSAGSLRGAAALVRRLERQLGCAVGEARIAPLRAVDTSVVTVPDAAAPAGRLRVLAAGVPTPGGTGACVGAPLSIADPEPRDGPAVAVVPPGLRYDEAAARLRALLATGTRIGAVLADLLDIPVHSPVSEPAAARLGALTTPGARDSAVVADLGAGTIDVIGSGATGASVVAAGAGELLTAAVAEMLGIPRAAADWVKRGPCVRVDGGQRFEAEDGTRGFLEVPAPASAAGMLAVEGPGGWLPFDRRRGPGEWRAIRLRLKLAVLAANFRRAVRTLGQDPAQVLVVGGPAGDEELLGVLAPMLPDGVAAGRGDVGGTCAGAPLGHRYAVALGLALV